MPLYLYHGPQCSEKQHAFFDLVTQNNPKTVILTHNQDAVRNLTIKLFQNLKSTIAETTAIKTLDDFLLEHIKYKMHRAHKATYSLCEYLLFLLHEKHNPGWFESQPDPLRILHDTYELFLQIKKSWGIFQNKKNFGLPLKTPQLETIFFEYNHILSQKSFYDEGDLLKSSRELILESNNIWSIPEHVVIFGINPLGPGERAWLRLCQKVYPKTSWHIFYDTNFADPSDLLSLAYEDLGQMAHDSFYFENEKSAYHTVFETSHFGEEIKFAIKECQNKLSNGVRAEEIAFACHPKTAPFLEKELEVCGIPFTSHFAQTIDSVFPNHSHKILEETSLPNTQLQRLASLAKQSLENRKDQWAFAQNLFSEHRTSDIEHIESLYWKKISEKLKFLSVASQHQIVIISYNQILDFDARFILALDFQLETFLNFHETSVLHAHSLSHKEWAEPLKLPSYEFRIQIEKIKQLLQNTQSLQLITSQIDIAGNPTTKIPFENLKIQPITLHFDKPYVLETQSVARSKKQAFSVTELQTYYNCPFQYYARYVLNFSQTPKQAIEPPAKTIGTFLHLVLHHIASQHTNNYRAMLKGEITIENWQMKVYDIINELAQNNTELKNIAPHLLQPFIKKIHESLSEFYRLEQKDVCDGKKQTFPYLFEWPFRLHLDSIEVTGRIDRIDITEDKTHFSVLDYKLGATIPSINAMKRAEEWQLPLYALALEQNLELKLQSSAWQYYSFKNAKYQRLVVKDSPDAKLTKRKTSLIEEDELEVLFMDLKDKIVKTTDAINSGSFDPTPRLASMCRACEFKHICSKHDEIL